MLHSRTWRWPGSLALAFALAGCGQEGPVQPEVTADPVAASQVAGQINDLGTVPPDFSLGRQKIADLKMDLGGEARANAPTSEPPPVYDPGSGTFTVTQVVDAHSTAPHYTGPWSGGGGYGFGYYSWFDQDYGWKHSFAQWNDPLVTITSAKLVVRAWDVDSEPWHGWGGEYDGLSIDGVWANPQYLQGTNGTWSVTTFDVPVSAIADDGWINLHLDIDMHHTSRWWATTLENSTLIIAYRIGPPNLAPLLPLLSLTPAGPPSNDDNLHVDVVGPDPADPDGHAVTYLYRWFVNIGTGGFLDPQFAGRGGPYNGPTVPASATRPGDQWRVQVTPVDELGAIGPFAQATFPPVVTNSPPVPVIQLNCPLPYYEGGDACPNGGPTRDPDEDVSTLLFHWDYGDGTTYEQYGVMGQPNHVYADDGLYKVTLRVTDSQGASASTSMMIPVENVAPAVSAGPDVTIDFAASFTLVAGFSDPGILDAPWTWTVNWGNGTNLSGSTSDRGAPFGGSIIYYAVGTFPVDACVTDKDGGAGCDQVQVTVTATYDGLCSLVQTWVEHKGVANSLCVKLDAAKRAQERGNTSARDGSLGAFINEVNAQGEKKVPADKVWILVAYAQALMS